MKKSILKYILIIFTILILIIFYLSLFGIETDKFNNQIKNSLKQKNEKLELKLKKINLTLDPFNFKINAKTIGTKIIHKKKIIELEYIKTKLSIISIIKNKFISSNVKISSKPILLKDLVALLRSTNNKPKLFILESLINKGYVILDIELNFDDRGQIKDDYKISGILKDGKINFLGNHNFNKINFIFDLKNNVFKFKDIKFISKNINFFSNNLKVTKVKSDLFFEGILINKKSNIDDSLLKLIESKFKSINLKNIKFNSKNNFSFLINSKFKVKNLVVDSEIQIDELKYKAPNLFKNYLPDIKDIVHLKNHKITAKYEKNSVLLIGSGKIQLENEYDDIEYSITNKKKDFKLVSDIKLSKLKIKSLKTIKKFFPESKKEIYLKDHLININYNKNYLSIKGLGKIKLDKQNEKIEYLILKEKNKFDLKANLDLNTTSINIDQLNYKKNKKLLTKISLTAKYEPKKKLSLISFDILDKNNKIIFKNLLFDQYNTIVNVDKVEVDFIDNEKKKNQFDLEKKKDNHYQLNGSIFNANRLISNLIKSKNKNQGQKLLKNNIVLNLNLSEVYIDNSNLVNNLKGEIYIDNSKVVKADISALFNDDENLTFTINTNMNGKVTTLFSSKAKSLVNRYNFIKGFEDGSLDFYSTKIDNISKSQLKIYDFKLKKLPALTKLLTLASLQGIADILSGEGIRFNEFEMNFSNKGKLMTIDEIYAIGPSISILMKGYVEEDKLISLRGTLVPATTINKTIGSIPFLGKILVGSKEGEGVFGVSFKIKGPPQDLETTVNPIKTLTPRFITRTLEKIKQN